MHIATQGFNRAPASPILVGGDFETALRGLGDDQLRQRTFKAAKRISEGDQSPGLNDELLHQFASGLESRSARVTQGQGAPRLIFARDDDRIVVLWVASHDQAYRWERRRRSQIPHYVQVAVELKLRGKPPPVPRESPDHAIHAPDPDLLGDFEAARYEEYFAALDSDQNSLVHYDTRNRKGLSFVKAGAGTGKTSIAIRRALHLASQPELGDERVLYLCYQRALMLTVRRAIATLASPEMALQIEANTFHGWADMYLQKRVARFSVEQCIDRNGDWLRSAIPQEVRRLSDVERRALAGLEVRSVLQNEIENVLSPNQFEDVVSYLKLKRPISQGLVELDSSQKEAIWALYRRIRSRDDVRDTWHDLAQQARVTKMNDPCPPRYRAVIVDEGQDCSPAMARLAKALVSGEERRLMVLADPDQDLYSGRYTWAKKEFGPVGTQLRILLRPYRSTRQIHALAAPFADEKLPKSQREGPRPRLAVFPTVGEGFDRIAQWVRAEISQGHPPGQIAVLTGSNRRRNQGLGVFRSAGVTARIVDSSSPPDGASVTLATVNAAKGLDFASVYLLDPGLGFGSPDSRRARFYVALTRSSRNLCIVCCEDANSPLLNDLDAALYRRVAA